MNWKQITSVALIVAIVVLFVPVKTYAAFSFSRSITVNGGQVPSTQTSFPMLVSGTYSYLATVANGGKVQNANGYDVGFYSNSNCSTGKLNWETEFYNATDGTVVYWINIASISNGSVIYMCYGDASISTDQSNPTAVWNSAYVGVWHLPDGTTLAQPTPDSTSNGNNATNVATLVTATSGQIDGAASFNGAGSYLDAGSNASLYPSTEVTVEAWIFPTSNAQNGAIAGPWATGLSASNAYLIFVGQDANQNKFGMDIEQSNGTIQNVSPSTTFSANQWYHVVGVAGTSGGAFLRMYINGVDTGATTAYDGTLDQSATSFVMGRIQAGVYYFAGKIDETRVSNIARSADWIATEYNNQSAPASFYTVGNETPLSGASAPQHMFVLAANRQTVFQGAHTFIFQ